MKVRRATFGDLPDVVRIERASFAGKGCSVTTFLAHVFRDRKGLLVAEDDTGRVIGYALARVGLRWLGIRRGGVTSIAVDPQHRRRGIGRALMAAALEHLTSQGVAEADLEVSVANRAAQSLYEAFGFVQCQLLPHYYGPNADGIKMALNMRDATISDRATGARGAQRSSSS